jgi:hypothetical protein
MAGTIVPTTSSRDVGGDVVHVPETWWRKFLISWQLGLLLVLGCIVGLIGIFTAHPFGSPSVSQRVSDAVGRPASCVSVGAAQVAGQQSTIYKCTVGPEGSSVAQCFTIRSGEVRQLSGARKLGC